jgi:hypothetical protein
VIPPNYRRRSRSNSSKTVRMHIQQAPAAPHLTLHLRTRSALHPAAAAVLHPAPKHSQGQVASAKAAGTAAAVAIPRLPRWVVGPPATCPHSCNACYCC